MRGHRSLNAKPTLTLTLTRTCCRLRAMFASIQKAPTDELSRPTADSCACSEPLTASALMARKVASAAPKGYVW